MVTMIAVDNYFYKGAKEELIAEAKRLEISSFELKERPLNFRKIVVGFDREGKLVAGEILDFIPKRINLRMVDMIRKETFTELGPSADEHNYLTLLKRVGLPNYEYIKIYVNVDGESSARDTVLKVYTICAFSIFFLSIAASYILSMKTIRPIVDSLEKQLNFVSDASHELRTPLAIVQSKIENILTDSEKTVYEVSEDLAISLKELSRLTKLTKDLLMLARNDNESINLDIEFVNLDTLLKNAFEPFEELSLMQNKKFSYLGSSIVAKVDRNKIYQVLIILLDNALIYTNEGDSIDISLSQNNSEILIEVADTGIGMSEFTKEHLFERFYREDRARSRSTGGNGLGLSIAKTLITHHKGKITVEDNHPKGTKFIISLPKSKSMLT
jgi:two-component system sensor histidine kinase CiaH